jgi:hypothetical protein
MQIAVSPRLVELTSRFRSSVAEHPDWWREHARSAPAGEPLAYHPQMGLTEAEYSELLSYAKRPSLTKVKDGRLTFRRLSSTLVELDSAGLFPFLDGIRIDFAADSVQAPYGVLRFRSEVNNTSEESPTGPWRGVSWSLVETRVRAETGPNARLALGRLTQTGEGILAYKVNATDRQGLNHKADFILIYPLDPID